MKAQDGVLTDIEVIDNPDEMAEKQNKALVDLQEIERKDAEEGYAAYLEMLKA